MLRAIQLVRAATAAVLIWFVGTATAAAQVPTVVELRSGRASAPVHNRSADRMLVTIELRHGTVADGHLTLGNPVEGLIAPREFALGPGATQIVRMLVREGIPSGTTLRLVTTLTPVHPVQSEAARDTTTGATARLVLATRLITKVVVQ